MKLRNVLFLTAGILPLLAFSVKKSTAWGFFAHRRINRLAVFTLPPQMMRLYKPHIEFITEHATDPDKLRYVLKEEGSHHFIDIDHYGVYPWDNVSRKWSDALLQFSRDTLMHYGIVPWYALQVYYRLENAFRDKNRAAILKWSAYLGHYVADACVPLHANSNYNGQLTGQEGIHALWESNIPEQLADTTFNYWTGKAEFVDHPGNYIWEMVLESASAADSVLQIERRLLQGFSSSEIYAYVNRNSRITRTFSPAFVTAYNHQMNGMVARRMSRAIHAVASLWYTAWVNAGQPDLYELRDKTFSQKDLDEFKILDERWHNASVISGRTHE